MRASLTSRRPSAGLDGPELDVTPVMNMFIILIPFLLGMAAFTKLAAHEISLPGNQPVGVAQVEAPPMVVAADASGLKVVVGDRVLTTLPRLAGALDTAGLAAALRAAAVDRVVVAAAPDLSAAEVVACLDAARAAGCDDVGLAAAPSAQAGGEVSP